MVHKKCKFKGWQEVANKLSSFAAKPPVELNKGQKASLRALADRLPDNGVIIADEVGMGKTRIAAVLAKAVIEAGGRVAVLVPPGLGFQWGDELQKVSIVAPPILRSLSQYSSPWKCSNLGENESKTNPWFQESILIISHAFANWRLSDNSTSWRWTLLPEVYAKWRKEMNGRWPNKYFKNNSLEDLWPRHAADCIVSEILAGSKSSSMRKRVEELVQHTPWPAALDPAEYVSNAQLRPWLEQAVGLGLGGFDLVIVDEAHKNRKKDSGLERLLENVILQSGNCRRLAMTATPVELNAEQWGQILERIQVDKTIVTAVIQKYVDAVNNVRDYPSDPEVRDAYTNAASNFRQALGGFLIRRDKREEPSVKCFQDKSGDSYHAYRREEKILVDTENLSDEWKQAVCAAEALSFVSRQSDTHSAKRLRLTLGNGHGISALLDQVLQDQDEDKKQLDDEQSAALGDQPSQESSELDSKRLQRVEWWQNLMTEPFKSNPESTLFYHPAILKAVKEIEAVCNLGEKVLVFGRFTRPLRALVQLLNAREMLRCIDEKRPWPQSKVHEGDNCAIEAAYKQMGKKQPLNLKLLNAKLDVQYQELEKQRSRIRESLIANIEKGFNKDRFSKRISALFKSFQEDISQEDDNRILAVVARAVQEHLDVSIEQAQPADFAKAFTDLITAASDRDTSDNDAELDRDSASCEWGDLAANLIGEYDRPEGGFARLMNGETAPHTRRLLQLAFNRKQGHPKVLVAQSLVGREGLNLHKTCRTVVLLHPEWNPGVVEQQIGRVDRLGSLWEKMLKEAIADGKMGGELPKIEIRPVIFKGTYDEKNWQVLNERWDELRAQLHGLVVTGSVAENYPEELVKEINDAAPNFTPSSLNL